MLPADTNYANQQGKMSIASRLFGRPIPERTYTIIEGYTKV